MDIPSGHNKELIRYWEPWPHFQGHSSRKNLKIENFTTVQTSVARTSLGPWKFVRDIGSSSQSGLIMAAGQEEYRDNSGIFFFDFLHNNYTLSILIRIAFNLILLKIFFSYFKIICINWFWSILSYSRFSLLSRIPRDSLKYFEISVPRHIRFAELRKK